MGNKKQPSQIEGLKKRLKGATLDVLLEEIGVLSPGMWDNKASKILEDWYAVTTDEDIIAYFGDEQDAFSFRLALINIIMNTK